MTLSSKHSVDQDEGKGRGECWQSPPLLRQLTSRNCDTGPLCKQGIMGIFPAYALLEIFSFYVDQARADEWYALAHVCQTWRYVVLGSPHRLNLHLLCTTRSPVRRMLDIWPPLPFVISNPSNREMCWKRGASDIIAALGHKDRIVEITFFDVPSRI